MLLTSDTTTQTGTGGSLLMTVLFFGFWILAMYLLLIRPQKKQQKEMDALRDSVQPGDNIMTTGGFYGVVLDVVDDTVIVEFGSNKNCRIPMNKNAIAEVERDTQEETKSK
jgi:preprotein translocase subunit YajC